MMTEKEEEQARDLFMMPGWEALMDEVQGQIDMCTLDACDSADDFWFTKGRLAALRMFANYEAYVRQLGNHEDEEYELQ